MENIREPQPLKDSIAFVYDTDVHQLASFIRSGPPLGRTKLMLAWAFLPGAGHPDLGTASAGRLHSTQGEGKGGKSGEEGGGGPALHSKRRRQGRQVHFLHRYSTGCDPS